MRTGRQKHHIVPKALEPVFCRIGSSKTLLEKVSEQS